MGRERCGLFLPCKDSKEIYKTNILHFQLNIIHVVVQNRLLTTLILDALLVKLDVFKVGTKG